MGIYIQFNELCDELIAQGKRFDVESLKLLTYSQLSFAGIGNAGKAICNYTLVEQEKDRRLSLVENLTFEQVEADKGKWQLLDDMHMYYAWYDKKAKPIPKNAAPKWRLLVESMHNLRADWSGGRSSEYLKEIYALLPYVETEGQVPLGWCKSVKMNADQFDGIFNDGRIMRDGALHLPKEIAAKFVMPQAVSGNMAKMFGAKHMFRESGYRGSYEELFEELLTSEQKIIYCSELKEVEYQSSCLKD